MAAIKMLTILAVGALSSKYCLAYPGFIVPSDTFQENGDNGGHLDEYNRSEIESNNLEHNLYSGYEHLPQAHDTDYKVSENAVNISRYSLALKAYPKYKYSYGVNDPHTGDIKNHWEERDGDFVKGSYSLNEADGTVRIVEYTADKYNGFNAKVHKAGVATHSSKIDFGH